MFTELQIGVDGGGGGRGGGGVAFKTTIRKYDKVNGLRSGKNCIETPIVLQRKRTVSFLTFPQNCTFKSFPPCICR